MTTHYTLADARAEFERAFSERWPLDAPLSSIDRKEVIDWFRDWIENTNIDIETVASLLGDILTSYHARQSDETLATW
jgi:hypothetical protein